MFSLLPFQRILVAASHVAPTVVLPQGPQGWGSTYTLFPNRSAEMTDGSEKQKTSAGLWTSEFTCFLKPYPDEESIITESHMTSCNQSSFSRQKREAWERDYRIIKFLRRSRWATSICKKKRSRCEMRNGYEACQISLLYFLLAFSYMTVHNVQWHSYHFPFVCLFVVVFFFHQ